MGPTGAKVGAAALLVALASQLSAAAEELVGRVRESVQASELLTVDGYALVWSLEQNPTRAPRDQAEFERACRDELAARAGREPTADRWGRTYVYEPLAVRGALRWRISSAGPDRRLGTEDDLVVERHGDASQINRDPTEIVERALARWREADAQALEQLWALALADRGGAPARDPSADALDAALGRSR